jgi:hypothetical protein
VERLMIYVCSSTINNDDIIAGKEVITSLQQLYVTITKKDCRELEIRKDFAEKFFTPSGMASFIEEAKKFNKLLKITTEEEYEFYYDSRVEELSNIRSVDGLVEYILRNRSDALGLIKHLCERYTSVYTESLVANNKLGIMHLQISEATNQLEVESRERYATQQLLDETMLKLGTLVSRINFSYEKDVDPEKLVGIELNARRYKKVLYIKEVTRVKYVDTFIYYMQEILKTLYGIPARLLVIESAYAYTKADLYPTCIRHTNLTYRDVYHANIVMAGFHPNIVEAILQNPSNIDYLIVLDRSGWNRPYLSGETVETIYTVSDLSDIKVFIPAERIISYNNQTLYVPYVEGFDKLTMEEKISKYSSFSSMQVLIELLEKRG